MILQEQTSKPIDRIAISDEIKFKIKASAKSFRLLSSTLYPDPIAAPIRELATNAHDSHVEAKNSEPFIVHLPNQFEPYFSVRDFGTGMTEHIIREVYPTYFDSTRTGSNDFTGAFGLGSKTPLCYGDTFNITSYVDGIKYFYTAFLENGEPRMAKFGEDVTDEKNGVNVSFPVDPKDFDIFIRKAKEIYSRFSIRPQIIGCDAFELEKRSYIFSGQNWKLKNEGNDLTVVMGNIGYPINTSKCGIPYGSEIASIGLELYFEIGELQPTVSREEIQYDQITCAKIKARLEEATLELFKLARVEVENCESYYVARMRYSEILSDYTNSNKLRIILKKCGFTYNGKVISSIDEDIKVLEQLYDKNNESRKSYDVIKLISLKGRVMFKIQKQPVSNFVYNARMKYFLSDESSDEILNKKLKYNISQNGTSNFVYLFDKKENPEYFKFLLNELGIAESMLIPVSTLPLPPKILRPSTAGVKRKPRNIKNLYAVRLSSDEKDTRHLYDTIDINNGEYLYVDSSFGQIVNGGVLVSSTILTDYIKCYKVLTGNFPRLYVFGSANKMVNPPKNWKEFFSEFEIVFSQYIKQLDLPDIPQLKKIISDNINIVSLFGCLNKNDIKNKDLYKLFDEIDSLRKNISEAEEKIKNIPSRFINKIEHKKIEKSHLILKTKCDNVMKKYPMLHIIECKKENVGIEKYQSAVKHLISIIKPTKKSKSVISQESSHI